MTPAAVRPRDVDAPQPELERGVGARARQELLTFTHASGNCNHQGLVPHAATRGISSCGSNQNRGQELGAVTQHPPCSASVGRPRGVQTGSPAWCHEGQGASKDFLPGKSVPLRDPVLVGPPAPVLALAGNTRDIPAGTGASGAAPSRTGQRQDKAVTRGLVWSHR